MALDKVADSAKLEADLTTVADSIRAKGGTSAPLAFPEGFASAVSAIDTALPTQEKTVSITANGDTTITPDVGKLLSKVVANVNVSGGGGGTEGIEVTKFKKIVCQTYTAAVDSETITINADNSENIRFIVAQNRNWVLGKETNTFTMAMSPILEEYPALNNGNITVAAYGNKHGGGRYFDVDNTGYVQITKASNKVSISFSYMQMLRAGNSIDIFLFYI